MLEYVLFLESVRNIFISWLRDNQIEYQLAGEAEELLVLIDEDIDQEILKKIEAQYDFLLDESARIADEEDTSPDSVHLVGVQFTRNNGEIGQIRIPPELANRIQQCLNTAELQSFVQLIADAVSNPTNKSLCAKIE